MQSLSIWIITFILVVSKVQSRILRLNSSDQLVSNGVDQVENQAMYGQCEHLYGFFPCADSVGGFIFLIAIYQYLLIVGEKMVSNGSKTLFNILGTGIFGATLFQILKAFPRIILVIASGVFSSKEKAQNQVSTGVSTNVGATVFNLTIMWGICVIFGAKERHEKSTLQPEESSILNSLQILKNNGVTIDKKTNYTAGIMLLSLIPFALMQLVNAFNTYFGRRIVIFATLVISVTFLLSYFIYQLLDPWIQERSLEYSKYENLLAAFLQHVKRHAGGMLIDKQGRPDIQVIQRLFSETDRDANKSITLVELEKLISDMQSGKIKVDKNYALSKILTAFDINNDTRIDEDEFVEGCKRWIEEAKMLATSDDSTIKRILYEVVQQYTKKQRGEIAQIEQLMAKILKHVESQALEAEHILKDDGSPNIERIKEIFHQYDSDGNKFITQHELEKLVLSVKYGEMQLNSDDSVMKVMKDFDTNRNNMIDEHEFVDGMTKWLNEAIRVTNCKDKKRAIDEYDKIMWGEVEKLVYEVEKDGEINYKLLTWAFNKSIFQVILGIAMLTLCSKPLVKSIQKLSEAIGMPSFLIPFVIVPLALNARMTIAAIFPASQKCSKTASLTFSEVDIWWSDHEQHHGHDNTIGYSVCKGLNLGLFSTSANRFGSLCSNWTSCIILY
ncbi:sodium/calcium exchanger NCL1-like isoform X2 [Solanum dulcamara]|uniref:sodium/calcium exchanger NCL1-like isoform X2 n=1 Tax=Solanum dulcamara TaxID=45834 RepID=UPI002485E2F9|nr:sodium/calcium exchanger NCL1-like isoform X2 [Solanum dulcamara]